MSIEIVALLVVGSLLLVAALRVLAPGSELEIRSRYLGIKFRRDHAHVKRRTERKPLPPGDG